MDLSVRNDGTRLLRWQAPSRTASGERAFLEVAIGTGTAPHTVTPALIHGDLAPSLLASALFDPPRCLGAWTLAHWDYGQGPAPRWLAPGMGIRALLLLTAPPQHPLTAPGLLLLRIDDAPPIGVVLPPPDVMVEAPLGWRGRREPSVPFVLPGGLVVDTVTVEPPRPVDRPGVRACEWGRRLTWVLHNPTESPLLPPTALVLDRRGWRLRPDPLTPDADAVMAPGERRQTVWDVPSFRDDDSALHLAFVAPQRADDPTTPWVLVDVTP